MTKLYTILEYDKDYGKEMKYLDLRFMIIYVMILSMIKRVFRLCMLKMILKP